MFPNIPCDALRDFSYVAMIAEVPSVLAVNLRTPVHDLAAFIAWARQRPGLAMGSPGNGSASHVKQVMFTRLARIETTHVPDRGSGPALSDLVAGQLDSLLATTVEAGRNERVRMLAVTGAERLRQWPELRTFAEQGFPDLVAPTSFAIAGPAGVPEPIHARMHEEVMAALALPETAQRLDEIGATPQRRSRAEPTAFVANEVRRWGELVRSANVTAD